MYFVVGYLIIFIFSILVAWKHDFSTSFILPNQTI